jgi:hypothetical protein
MIMENSPWQPAPILRPAEMRFQFAKGLFDRIETFGKIT